MHKPRDAGLVPVHCGQERRCREGGHPDAGEG